MEEERTVLLKRIVEIVESMSIENLRSLYFYCIHFKK